MTDKINQINADVTAAYSKKISTSAILLSSARGTNTTAGVRNSESGLGNLVADAMRIQTGADFAITNGGGLRADIAAGDITKGTINAVLPFGNYGVVKTITAKQLKQVLENGVMSAPAPVGKFPHISGFKFEYNSSNEAGNKVTRIIINGKTVDMNDTTKAYKVVVNDFMANGGDGYTALSGLTTVAECDTLDSILEKYVVAQGGITANNAKTDGRIIDVYNRVYKADNTTNVKADYANGVLPAGATLKISKLLTGSKFTVAQNSLKGVAENFVAFDSYNFV